MIKNFKSRALKAFAEKGDTRKLPVQGPAVIAKLTRQLAALDAAVEPDDLNLPGFGFHGLQGKPKRWAVTVSANYRVTYAWEKTDAIDVDIEDYH